jgi:hypothetical protein
MPQRDPLDAFYLVLDDSPGDPLTTQALADWYEEQGNSTAAACLRWALRRGRWPFRYFRHGPLRVASDAWHEGWCWWVREDMASAREWGYPRECCLPLVVWERLRHSFDYDPGTFKQYPSRRAAYEALFAAWLSIPRRDRFEQE